MIDKDRLGLTRGAAGNGMEAMSPAAGSGVRVNAILPRARTRLTEGLTSAARPDRFDKWDPATISPFVAYLLGADTETSGQVFLVGGGLVQRAAPWRLDPDWKLDKPGRWQIDELAKPVAEAGSPTTAGRDTGGIPS